MSARRFSCRTCGREFSIPQATLSKYPGWKPSQCLSCRDRTRGDDAPAANRSGRPAGRAATRRRGGSGAAGELLLGRQEVLERFTAGPHDGVFTDGACSGNPGPGGWGVVWVADDRILAERSGFEPRTTNNRMELTALIVAYNLLPADSEVTIWSDSQLCVNTLNDWAHRWKAAGWRKKGGPIKNLELVQEAFDLARAHPRAQLRWIKAHDGSRWNEYADALATAFMREQP